MPQQATAAVYEGPHKMRLRNIELPQISADDMIVRTEICGVDGSEVHQFRGEFEWLNERAPLILGDEIIGRVHEIGERARARRGLAEGDRVIVEARWPCEGCPTCDKGQYYLCERRRRYGYGLLSIDEPGSLWGGYATHVFVPPQALVYRVPQQLSLRAALIACSPLANGLAWTRAAGVTRGQHVAVVGPGPQGLSCAVAAWHAGADVTLIGTHADSERLGIVAGMPIRTYAIQDGESAEETVLAVQQLNGPVDVVIEVAGAPAAKALSLRLARAMGTIVTVAVPSPHVQEIDWMNILSRQLTIRGVVAHPHGVPDALQLAVELQGEGLDVGAWVTHEFGIDQAELALETAGYLTAERPVKTAFVFDR